jgi:signal transduction histidine kinase
VTTITASTQNPFTSPFIEGGGEMGKLTRNFDWASSALGTPDQWPNSLRTTLGILLHSAFPMFLFWGKDLICFYNDAYRPSLGENGKHPAVGKKGKEVWREIWHFIGPLIADVMEKGEPVWYEDQYLPIFRNGQMEDVYWTFSYSPAYGDSGEVEGVFVTCVETTKSVNNLRKLEENEMLLQRRVAENTREIISQKDLLDNIMRNSSNGISVSEVVRDSNGVVIDARTILANNSAIKFTGLPEEIYLSKTAAELDPGILQSEYGKSCVRTLQTGEPFIMQYFLGVTKRWLELTVSKMSDDRLIHIFTDVTDIKEAQLRLENLVMELKRSNSNLEDFAYAASHDLKEPVRKIRFYADYIRQILNDRMTEVEKRYLDKMDSASKRMGALIDDLLAYSQVSMEKTEPAKVNLNEVITHVLEDLDLEIEQRKAKIEVGEIGITCGDEGQLRQVFHNLVSNALKYKHPEREPQVRIYSKLVMAKDIPLLQHQVDEEKKFHEITVADNGIGFRQNDAERIFSVFTRLHNSDEYVGTGVGLSIVRKVVENHGGIASAAGQPGNGASFKIYLPEHNSLPSE